MEVYVNECYGCADGCHGCGRDHMLIEVCDSCELSADKFYNYDSGTYCEDCMEDILRERVTPEDLFEGLKIIKLSEEETTHSSCDYCDGCSELYKWGDEVLCKDCLIESMEDSLTVDDVLEVL